MSAGRSGSSHDAPFQATSSEGWALSRATPGWADLSALDLRAALDDEIRRLRVECDSLARRCEEAQRAARAEGFEEGLRRAREWVELAERELRERDRALASRAVEAALAAAAAVIRADVSRSADTARALVLRALEWRPGERPVRLRVPGSAVDAARAVVATRGAIEAATEVVVDPALCDGDLIIEFRDGQIDARLDSVLELLRADVEAEVNGG